MTTRLSRRPLRGAALLAWIAGSGAAGAQRAPREPAKAVAAPSLPSSVLAVWRDGGWRPWWRSDRAPARWTAAAGVVAGAVRWRSAAPGVEWAEVRLAGSGEAWRLRVVLVRIDPARVRFRLQERGTADGSHGAWTIDSAPPSAVVATNAGQFVGGSPWGWVVDGGAERYSIGRGPLSSLFVADRSGAVTLLDAAALTPEARAGAVTAFQSYPTLLVGDGSVPGALLAGGGGVDVGHRDARLALGRLRDGRLVVALTRFDALHGVLDEVPFGLTTPETAALMGALGCAEAVALDGGISAQLLVRGGGTTHEWHGLRAVPLGLLVERR